MIGNLNLEEIQKVNLSNSVVDISELNRAGEKAQRQVSQTKMEKSNQSSHQPMQNNKHMINIKSYCDLGRSMSNVSNAGQGALGTQTHGHGSLTRDDRRGGGQAQHPTLDCFVAHMPQSQINTNYGSTTSQQNVLFQKNENLNTLPHGTSGFNESTGKLPGTDHRPSMLNHYTLSQ